MGKVSPFFILIIHIYIYIYLDTECLNQRTQTLIIVQALQNEIVKKETVSFNFSG